MIGNGQGAVNGELTPEPQGPPWMAVDPEAIIRGLQGTVAAQATEMAAMRAYIAQLHQALQLAATVPAEETPAGTGPGVG